MPRRSVLTDWQREAVLALPREESIMLQHYVLSDEDISHIKQKRDIRNQWGFALQLCALRYPGRYLSASDALPQEMVAFVAAQISIDHEELSSFTYCSVTRYEHLRVLQMERGEMNRVWNGGDQTYINSTSVSRNVPSRSASSSILCLTCSVSGANSSICTIT